MLGSIVIVLLTVNICLSVTVFNNVLEKISCTSQGTKHINYLVWYHNSKEIAKVRFENQNAKTVTANPLDNLTKSNISTGSIYFNRPFEKDTHLSIEKAHPTILHLNLSSSERDGNYSCLTVFMGGRKNSTVTHSFELISTYPLAPRILNLSSGSTTINITMAPNVNEANDSNSRTTDYDVELHVNDTLVKVPVSACSDKRRVRSCRITQLSPNTKYMLRVTSHNLLGGFAATRNYTTTKYPKIENVEYNVSIVNITNSSAEIRWSVTGLLVSHGISGFKVSYHGQSTNPMIVLVDKSNDSATLKNLTAFEEYFVQLVAFNNLGDGQPSALKNFSTLEGTPDAPQLFDKSASYITSSSIRVNWNPLSTRQSHGILLGYQIQYRNDDDLFNFNVSKSARFFDARNLTMHTLYTFKVAGYTSMGVGVYSESLAVNTTNTGPTLAKPCNVSAVHNAAMRSIMVTWNTSTSFGYRNIDFYLTIVREQHKSLVLTTLKAEATSNMSVIRDVSGPCTYEVVVVSISSATDTLEELRSNNSDIASVHMPSYGADSSNTSVCGVGQLTVDRDGDANDAVRGGNTVALTLGAVSAVLVILCLVLLVLVLWKRQKFGVRYAYAETASVDSSKVMIELKDQNISEMLSSNCVSVREFRHHVSRLHADSDHGFSEEYESIQRDIRQEITWKNSLLPENKLKNRYVNVVAFDHTRVQLRQLSTVSRTLKPTDDYINANFVDGYDKPNRYIASQGPLKSTFADFWKMIYDENTYVIVMITNLVERGRRKCDQYWPTEGTEVYGSISVTIKSTLVTANYTLRSFLIRDVNKSRRSSKASNYDKIITQWHYTQWPDHGTPDFSLPVLTFIRKSMNASPEGSGPVVVHCSAGVGRTGTYIVIDAMLRMVKEQSSLNVYNYLKHIRNQRTYSVQTEEQYVFIHDALLEAIDSGDTEIPKTELRAYCRYILQPGKDTGMTPLERQFMAIQLCEPQDYELLSSKKPCNKHKNRSPDIVPVDTYRVVLTAKPGVEGSDYINASFLQGYTSVTNFIVTQHPTAVTIPDFWQMVWDQNSQTVVMVTGVDKEDDEPIFWPIDEKMDCSSFTVSFAMEEYMPFEVVSRDFILESTQDDYVLEVRIFQCSYWPDGLEPIMLAFDLVNNVIQWHEPYDGPITVMDRFGGVKAGTFCALMTLRQQMNNLQAVDLYQLVKLYYMKRPNIFNNKADYHFFFKALESLLDSEASNSVDKNLSSDTLV